jgi:hypothetical protein
LRLGGEVDPVDLARRYVEPGVEEGGTHRIRGLAELSREEVRSLVGAMEVLSEHSF